MFNRNVVLHIARKGFNMFSHALATVDDNRIERCGGDAFDITGVFPLDIIGLFRWGFADR